SKGGACAFGFGFCITSRDESKTEKLSGATLPAHQRVDRLLFSLSIHEGGIQMRKKIEQLRKRGQGLVEYALILVLIAIVVILILTFLGQKVNDTFSTVGSALKP